MLHDSIAACQCLCNDLGALQVEVDAYTAQGGLLHAASVKCLIAFAIYLKARLTVTNADAVSNCKSCRQLLQNYLDKQHYMTCFGR